jgi:hypothetical protein
MSSAPCWIASLRASLGKEQRPPVSRLREHSTEHHPRGQGSERVAGHRVALGHEQRQQRPARKEGEIDVSPSDEESEADQWHAETECDLGQADDRARTEQTEEPNVASCPAKKDGVPRR